MRGNRIIIPHVLKEWVIELAYEGHQDIVRTKYRLGFKVWWPEVDKMVENKIKKCYSCQIDGEYTPPEELRSTQLPDKPWNYVAVDLLSQKEMLTLSSSTTTPVGQK